MFIRKQPTDFDDIPVENLLQAALALEAYGPGVRHLCGLCWYVAYSRDGVHDSQDVVLNEDGYRVIGRLRQALPHVDDIGLSLLSPASGYNAMRHECAVRWAVEIREYLAGAGR